MKNPKFTHALQQIRNVTMTDSEKKAMLARIVASTAAPVYSKPVRSPWTVFSFGWASHQPWATVVAACLIIVGVGGVSLGAERALPGTILYPIKVSLNEPIRDRLVTTPESQALWSATKSQRRINEAAELAVTNTLDQATQERLQERLDIHTHDLTLALDQVRESSSPERADEIRVVFQATLGAQAEVLQIMSQDDVRSSSSEDARIVVATLARTSADSLDGMNVSVQALSYVKTAAPMMVAMNVSPEADTSMARTASSQQPQTEESYVRVQQSTEKLMMVVLEQLEKASATQGSLQEKLLTRAAESLDQAKAYFEQAAKTHDAGDTGISYTLMRDAQRSTIEAHMILRAALKKIK